MKESEAWKILAEEHDKGTRSPYLCDNLNEVLNGYSPPNPAIASIPDPVRQKMISRIKANITGFSAYPDLDGMSASPTNEEEAEAKASRVLACLMFSEQAKEERR